MRKVTMIRLGVMAAVAVIGAVGAIASGCSSDDSGQPPQGTPEAGPTPDSPTGPAADGPTGGNPDTGPITTDSGTDAPPPPPAQLVLTHAAPGIGPFRLCFATVTNDAGTVVPLTATPDTPNPNLPNSIPGVLNGTIGAFAAPADLSTLVIRPYVILNIAAIGGDVNADASATPLGVGPDGGPEETCQQLIGKTGAGGRLVQNVDYVQLPDVGAGKLLDYKTYLLSLVGCLPGNDGGTAECGQSYDNTAGNLHFGIAQLDTTTQAPDGGIAVQFAHLSSALEGLPFVQPGVGPIHGPASGGVAPGIIVPTADGGTTFLALVDGGVPYSAAAVNPGTAQVYPIDPAAIGTASGGQAPLFGVVTLPLSGAGSDGVPYPGTTVANPDGGAPIFVPGDLIALPFSAIEQLSRWDVTTTGNGHFSAGHTYTFAIEGSPQEQPLVIPNPDGGAGYVQNPNYTGKGLHIVAFPNNFTNK